MFAKYDTDESGDIDTKELRSLFADLGVQKSESDIHSIMDKYASMQSPRKLSYIEFEKLFSISRLLDVFHQLDANRSGTVDGNELETAMHLLGYKLSRVQIGAMIRTIDSNGDKEITFDEFRDFFETAPLASLESIAAQWSNAVAESDCGSDFAAAPPIPGLHWWQTMIAGGLAGVAARTVTAPLEKVKIVAQTGQGLGQGMVAELVAIARSQEIRGLFAGNAINCIRVFPTGGITCTVYLNLLSLAPTSSSSGNVLSDPVYRLFCGGAAGLVANVLTYPMDLIRARVTVSTTPEKGLTELKKICSDVIHGGIYRGLRPTLMAVVPFVAVQNASIDVLKDR
jgi:Ca2+-binding EF-hand superfamily protein